MSRKPLILVTGATGYIGGRLVPRLLELGYRVRCLARDPERLAQRPWSNDVEIVQADALKAETLPDALRDVSVAYYLIHSLAAGEEEFESRDTRAAQNFAAAAERAGVERIIYLGGIQPKSERQSRHLLSRLETGDALRSARVPVTEFRAAVIVGSGSLSFELIRYLTERVPILITPRWVSTPTQPIAVRNVLNYLTQALDVPESSGRIIEIGGEDVLTYGEMFLGYAKARGLRRYLLHVPVLTPRLSSLWVGLVTPINSRIARPIIEGLDNKVIVTDNSARELFDVQLLDYDEAVARALARFEDDKVETIWSGAASTSIGEVDETLEDDEGMFKERRQIRIRARPEEVFSAVKMLGGKNGWLYANALWKVRGFMDLLVGGVGMRVSRRSYTDIREGDTVDFWRVEEVEDNRLLRLRAEMKLPGTAWLQFEVGAIDGGESVLTQTAFFEPKGLFGFLYWYFFAIPHRFIFPGMLRALGARAEELASSPGPDMQAA